MQILKENREAIIDRWGAAFCGEIEDLVISEEKTKDLSGRFHTAEQYVYDYEDPEVKNTLFAMVMGFGTGGFIRNLKKTLLNTAVVFVWEPDQEAFQRACAYSDISDLLRDTSISIVVGTLRAKNKEMERELLRRLEYFNMYHAGIFPSPGFFDCYGQEAKDLIAVFKKVIFEASTDAAARDLFRQTNSRCELLALSQLPKNSTADRLLDQIPTREVPVILVAAGPSLQKNVKLLRKVYDRALVIVVSHAAKTLYTNEVKPHLVAMADGQDGQKFLDFDTEQELTILANVRCAADIQKKYNGKLIYSSLNLDLFPVSSFKRNTYLYHNGGSVATDVFGLLATAGFGTIILVGQDLAYSEDGYSHVGGESEASKSDQYVEGINGSLVKTRGDWVYFLKSYERTISEHQAITVIDATEGGAKIHGTKILSLEQAIETYCQREYPIEEWVGRLPKGGKEEADEVLGIVQKHYTECRVAQKRLEEAIFINRNIEAYLAKGELGDPSHAEECRRYDSLYQEILTSGASELLMDYCDDLLQSYVKEALSLEADSDLQIKLEFERSLFVKMRERNKELMVYLIELFPEVDRILG